MANRIVVIVTAVCAVLALVGVFALIKGGGYELRVVVPSAAQLVVGSPVRIKGDDVGQVGEIEERSGRAIVTISVDSEHAPLREGMTAKVDWQSVLGERLITIEPGPPGNAELPSGALYEAQASQVEVDQVLAALDPPTRERLKSLVEGLRRTTDGQEQNIQATLRSAGPSVQALGEILAAVGRDGPAIRTLVTEMHQMVGGLADRQDRLAGTVNNLTAFTGRVATNSKQLSQGLHEVPSALDSAKATLDKVPSAVDATVPMLDDLRPGAERLPSVADNLRPVMADLRPVANDLRPAVSTLAELLRFTPELMNTGRETFPRVGTALEKLGPATEFLRPYTPEFIGWLSNFGSGFSNFDSQGHFWSIATNLGSAALMDSPAAVPPFHVPQRPTPGAVVDQPWSDANGSGGR